MSVGAAVIDDKSLNIKATKIIKPSQISKNNSSSSNNQNIIIFKKTGEEASILNEEFFINTI